MCAQSDEKRSIETKANLQAKVMKQVDMLNEKTSEIQTLKNRMTKQLQQNTSEVSSSSAIKNDMPGTIQRNQDQDGKHDTGHKLKKPYDDTLRELFVHQYSAHMRSVGCLMSQICCGTLFRVGTKYGMTAAHVINNIINPHRQETCDATRLCQDNVFVSFSEAGVDQTLNFKLTGRIAFCDNALDVAIVEFAEEGTPVLPPPLSLLSHDVFRSVNDVAVVGYGHRSNNFKCVEHSVKVVEPSSVPANDIKNYLEKHRTTIKPVLKLLGKDSRSVDEGYNGYDDKHHILLNAYVGQGASGSPIFSKADPAALKVVGIYTCGYPKFSYDLPTTYPFPQEWTFEAGTKMNFIYNELKRGNEELANDIFRV